MVGTRWKKVQPEQNSIKQEAYCAQHKRNIVSAWTQLIINIFKRWPQLETNETLSGRLEMTKVIVCRLGRNFQDNHK